MDSKACLTGLEFSTVINGINKNEIELRDNYDAVFHLVTAAKGAEEFYTLSNNDARKETLEEARVLDKKTIDSWNGHKKLKIIDNSTNFEEKINVYTHGAMILAHLYPYFKYISFNIQSGTRPLILPLNFATSLTAELLKCAYSKLVARK